MGSVSLALPKVSLAELLKLVGLPTSKASENEHAAAEIAGRASELIRGIASVVDGLVSTTIEKRTASDFVSCRAEVFPQYFAVMRAFGDLARIVIQKQEIERLSAEWFSELEADFRDLGPSAFGSDLSDRGIFTVWTLRKISDLAQEIAASPSPKET